MGTDFLLSSDSAKSITKPSSGLLSSSAVAGVGAGLPEGGMRGGGALAALSSGARRSDERGTVRATGPISGPFSTLARGSSPLGSPFSVRHWSSSTSPPGPTRSRKAASSGSEGTPSTLLVWPLDCRGGGIRLASFSPTGLCSPAFFSVRTPDLPVEPSLDEFFSELALLWATRGTSVGSPEGALSHGKPWLGLGLLELLEGTFFAGVPIDKLLSFCELLTFAPLERLPLDDDPPIFALLEEHLYMPDILVTVSLMPAPSLSVPASTADVLPSFPSLPSVGLSLFSHVFNVTSGLGVPISGTAGTSGDAIVLVSLAITALRHPLRDFGGLLRLFVPPATEVVGTIVMLGAAVDVGDGRAGLATTGVIVVEEGKLRCFSLSAPVGDEGGCFATGLLLDMYAPPAGVAEVGLLGLLFCGDFGVGRLSASAGLGPPARAGCSGLASFFPLLTKELLDFFTGGRDAEGLKDPWGFVVRLKACWECSVGSGEAATAGSWQPESTLSALFRLRSFLLSVFLRSSDESRGLDADLLSALEILRLSPDFSILKLTGGDAERDSLSESPPGSKFFGPLS